MRLPRKLYLLTLVLLPMALSGVMGVSVTRWLAAELESDSLEKDLEKASGRLEQLRRDQEREARAERIPVLPEDPGVAGFLSQIEKAAVLSGITCDAVTVPQDQESGQQEYEIAGRGAAGHITRFLALVERDPRIPIARELRIFATKDEGTSFRLALVLYHKRGAAGR